MAAPIKARYPQWILGSKPDLNPLWKSERVARLLILIALTVTPFWGIYSGISGLIAGGSPITYLAVVPALGAMIAYGYRTPPHGVSDPESDWILAAVCGGLGLFLRHLMSNRFPALSGLWHLPLVGAVLWAACLASVLFGVRRVMQTWPLWVFLVATVTPLPYLLFTAAAGGGTIAAAAVTGVIGSVALALAGTLSPMRWRLGGAAVSATLSIGVGFVAAGSHLDQSVHSGLLISLLTGGVLPLIGFVVLQVRAARSGPAAQSTLPKRSVASLVALCLGAVGVFVLNIPFSNAGPAPAQADANWLARMNLSEDQSFPFIGRYLGPHATFTRHRVASRPGFPEAAVDVITADNLAALQTFRDAIWYPATVPPNYRPLDLGNAAITDGRGTATDSALATNGQALDWYIVTWLWQVGSSYQQVFVVVNQTWTSQDPPPFPAALSVRATIIGPALWLARQQADPSTTVDPSVSARARQIIEQVVAAGEPRHG
ncbi:MAG: hypothetical protein ACOYB7_13870 [Mycobacterium sp.]